ncbi:MAG: hypothetical protein RLZZ26_183 [Candidatus Parcubacteria bacterium]|jgi:DNA-binding MarR family transcriptional regulator
MLTEKQQKAWEEFKSQMAHLRRRRTDVLTRISKKIDEQQLISLKNKLNVHE